MDPLPESLRDQGARLLSIEALAGSRLAIQDQDGDAEDGGDIISEIGGEIEVVVNRWSAGQLGWAEFGTAAAILAGGALLAWIVRRFSRPMSRRASGLTSGAIHLLSELIAVALVFLSLALALEVLGFSLGPVLILILVGIVGLLILWPLITNLSTGLLLQIRSAFTLGDLISTNNGLGTVEEVNARTVVLTTADGRRLHIPNTEVLQDTIINYSALGRRRSSVEVVLESLEDVSAATELVRGAMHGHEVLAEPEPQVSVARLEGRHVVIEGQYWHAPSAEAERAARDAVTRAVVSSLTSSRIYLSQPRSIVSFETQNRPAGETP